MINLTYIGSPYDINPDKIDAVVEDGKGSIIHCGDREYGADQNRSEVTRKILEYKLLMIATKSASDKIDLKAFESAQSRLRRLAGLEEQA